MYAYFIWYHYLTEVQWLTFRTHAYKSECKKMKYMRLNRMLTVVMYVLRQRIVIVR